MNSYNEKKNSYVRKQLLNTLLEMLKTKSLDDIIINDLVDKAGVSRVSFYRNYTDKRDILVQEEKRLFGQWNRDYETRNSDHSLDFTEEILNYYKRNSVFYLALYKAGLSDIVMDTILSSADIKDDDPNPIAYLKSSISYLIYGWVHEWMKRGMQESGTELSQMIKQSNNLNK
ncbi:MAG: TetR/AcrR family transcriptional regulator [Erysipelotrichaceae bacterium]|nr:TetR/AcrR family transcriptional regulator [Clostridia bacterium]MBQ6216222.1 TetR/AcrR family transcriptional regulator [Erysipelotrichaceae bacterium]